MRPLLALFFVVMGATGLSAQIPPRGLPSPEIKSVFPPGGSLGSALEVTLRGIDLEGPRTLLFSRPGVKCEFIAPPAPKVDPKKPLPPPVDDVVKFRITLPKDCEPGICDLRFVGRLGVSPSRPFMLGRRPETSEREPNDDLPQANRVAIGETINGTVQTPTDVDYFLFSGKKGQELTASSMSLRLDSRLTLSLELYDSQGQKVAQARGTNLADAVIEVKLPKDDEYHLRVSDFGYQKGDPDSIYRITLAEGIVPEAMFPPIVPQEQNSQVTLLGRSQFSRQAELPPRKKSACENGFRTGPLLSATTLLDGGDLLFGGDAVPSIVDDLPSLLEERDAGDEPTTATPLTIPCWIQGHIGHKGDVDFYQFGAKKGETIQIELFGERLGSQADFTLRLRDSSGRDVIAEADDEGDSLQIQTFVSRHADPPPVRFVAPADGTYQLVIAARDSETHFGDRAFYAVRLSSPRPDYCVMAMSRSRIGPVATNLPAEGTAAIDLFLQRRDGFMGPVEVRLADPPPGVTAKSCLIGPGQRYGSLILQADSEVTEQAIPIRLVAKASIEGKSVERIPRPATLRHPVGRTFGSLINSRRDDELVIATVKEQAALKIEWNLRHATVKVKEKTLEATELLDEFRRLRLSNGAKLTLPIESHWRAREARTEPIFLAIEPTTPGGRRAPFIATERSSLALGKEEAYLTIEVAPDVEPGLYQIVIRGETAMAIVRDPARKERKLSVAIEAYAEPLEIVIPPKSPNGK